MKIGIDTFGCDSGQSGIGSYLVSLIKNTPNDTLHTFDLFGRETDRFIYNEDSHFVSYTGVNAGVTERKERIWHISKLLLFIKKQKYDILLFPSGTRMLPMQKKIPSVLVVSDVLHNLYNKTSVIQRFYVRMCLRRATKIIAPSQYIRKNLLSLGIAPEKIEVIHYGIDHELFYPRVLNFDETVLIKPFSIKRPYVIYPSKIQGESKKHIELIRAFNQFKKNTGAPHRLVLAGADGKDAEKVHEEVKKSQYASDIVLTGFFPQASFPDLYSAAEACLFPSVNEGVGLPVIEAMSMGVPVACAKAGALPELAGEHALFFDPDNIEDFSNAITRVLTDEPLRQKLIQSGYDWTRRFDWQKTTAKTLEVLELVYKSSIEQTGV